MLSSEGKRRLTMIAMFGLPIVLVKATGMVLVTEGVDASTKTAVAAAPPAVSAGGGAEVPPAHRAAGARARELRARDFGPTPLLHQTRREDPPPERRSVPQFTISAIMAAPSGDLAVIGSRYYRVGDTLAGTSWKVVGIDAVGRSVTIEDPRTGDRAVQFVDKSR